MKTSLSLLAVALVAGCGSTKVVHVKDPRPLIRDNVGKPAQVRANFAGKPADTWEQQGFHCEVWGSPQSVINSGEGPAWILRVCYRAVAS